MDWSKQADIKVWLKSKKEHIEILANTGVTSVLKILKNDAVHLKFKISKRGKLTILVIASWMDDVKPIILS